MSFLIKALINDYVKDGEATEVQVRVIKILLRTLKCAVFLFHSIKTEIVCSDFI